MEKKKVIILCIAIALVASFVTGIFMFSYQKSQKKGNEIRVGAGSYQDIQKYMEISDLEGLINEYYYKETPEDVLINGTLKGMVGALGDPYSMYYTEEEYKDYKQESDGTFVGIGVAVGPHNGTGELKVENVYAGSPAETAGIVEGDVIIKVDGVAIKNMDSDGAKNLVSGPSGSTVKLTLQSAGGTGEERQVDVVRAEVQTQYVSYTMIDEEIGFVVISEFRGKCVQEFKDALAYLKEEGAKGVVIDVRGNGGGSFKDAVSILDEIVPEGLLVYTVDKAGNKEEFVSDKNYFEIPMAVLVDGNTASASEVFAGAVKDRGVGIVVGTRTFGKGVVQTVLDMPYSGGGVKLTTAEYYTPSGGAVSGFGIVPDEEVSMPEGGALTQEADTQLQAGIAAVKAKIG